MGKRLALRRLASALVALSLGAAPVRAQAPDPASEPSAATPPAAVPPAGPMLRDAVRAARAGDADLAARELEAVALAHPIVADHADLLRARTLLAANRPEAAAAAAKEGVARSPDSPLRCDLWTTFGEAQRALGNDAEALRAFSLAVPLTDDPARLATIGALRARSLERIGDAAGAAQAWRAVWRRFPTRPEAREAADRLDALEASLGAPVRDADDLRARGDALFGAGWNEGALAAFDAALARGLEGAARRDVSTKRAHCLFRLRRYADARAAFEALAPDPDAALYRARAIARSGDVPGAVAAFESLAEGAPAPVADSARYFAATLLEDDGELDRAAGLYARVAESGSDPALASQAGWRLGWTAYRAGRYTEARQRLSRVAAVAPDLPSRLQAVYWGARAGEKSGAPEAAAELARLAAESPLSYYGWRAGQRMAEAGMPAPDARATPEPGPSLLAPAQLERAHVLLEADLRPEAEEEIARLAPKAGGLGDRIALARLYAEADAHDRAQALVVEGNAELLARAPAPGAEALWRLAWPAAYEALVRAAAAPDAPAPPPLVWAIMREESGYRPDVVSSAGARGLLQIMPDTGTRLAADAGLAGFHPDDLFRPEVNVRLGALYLDRLVRRFDGRFSAAIGSYNAGPEAVSRWLAQRADLDDAEWVESIPYEQTRGYVRRVLRSLRAYRVLY